MKEWFEALSPREQVMVFSAAVLGVLTMYFIAIWEPLQKSSATLTEEIGTAHSLAAQMRQAGQEAAQYGHQGGVKIQGGNRSLLSLVDDTGRRAGLASSIKRIQPEGDTTVRVWLEDASFKQVVQWLQQMKTTYGIHVSNAVLDRDEASGTVKVRMSLKRGGA